MASEMRIWCTYEVATSFGDPTMPAPAIKITEAVRAARVAASAHAQRHHATSTSQASPWSSPRGALSGRCSISRAASIPPPASAGAAERATRSADADEMSVTEARGAALAAKSRGSGGQRPASRSYGLTRQRRGFTLDHSHDCRRSSRRLRQGSRGAHHAIGMVAPAGGSLRSQGRPA